MGRWADFAADEPEMAEQGRALLYQYGPGLGYLATVRRDGAPRLHPFCPLVHDGGLYAFVVDSPKRWDLVRDGRYAMHACGPQDRDDEFFCSGRARRIDEPETREAAEAAYLAGGATLTGDEWLFELEVDRALVALYRPRAEGPSWPPRYFRWRER